VSSHRSISFSSAGRCRQRARRFVLPGDRRLLLVALPLEVLEHDLGTG